MNATVEKFIRDNNIDVQQLELLDSYMLNSLEDINFILNQYRNYSDRQEREVSIADIEGYDYRSFSLSRDSMVDNMDNFFDAEGSGYKRRSASMLDLTAENIMQRLSPSFEGEPIQLQETEKGRFVIGDNGMHRFHVLRLLYLSELTKIPKEDVEAKAELKKKYTIKANVRTINYFQSYCNFLLKKLRVIPSFYMSANYDSDCNLTGKVDITIEDETRTLTNEELLSSVKRATKKSEVVKEERFFDSIEYYYEKYPSFKEFIDGYFPTLLQTKGDEWNF